jgi:catechol 2,3-dioxygenase-like lactoylglutathione lyase family enzyme
MTSALPVEVITLPVSDVARALRFYIDEVGFALDVDYAPADVFRVAQLTPPGSSCSIQVGLGLTDAPAGSLRKTCLVVTDLQTSRAVLLERGVQVSEIPHKTPVGAWDGGFGPGRTQIPATTRASPTSPSRTTTPGCSRNAASRTARGAFPSSMVRCRWRTVLPQPGGARTCVGERASVRFWTTWSRRFAVARVGHWSCGARLGSGRPRCWST